MADSTVRVAVTGAAGQIGYALLFRIASGQAFGPDTKVRLQLLELPAALPALEGVRMELDDCAFPLLEGVTCTSDTDEAFVDANWALLVGAVPRKEGMERKDLLSINGGIFTGQGESSARTAASACRVLVVVVSPGSHSYWPVLCSGLCWTRRSPAIPCGPWSRSQRIAPR